MLSINTHEPFIPMPVLNKRPAQTGAAQADPSEPLDPVDVSSFARVDYNTDAGAVKDPNKKSFKSMKDYIQYMLLMYAKLRDLKAAPGELNVKMEDQHDLAKTQAAINNAELV